VSAQDYEDILRQLGAGRVISSSLREELAGLGGFRNILVHGYLRLDPIAWARSSGPRRPGSAPSPAIRAWLETTVG
jgi:uncharacterized protein YutE (UPF0331/DUF86 family)